ncbi:hypothetical protein PBI_MYXUS_94 [Mycobacterium phage Myxus]|uniref:Gp84-like domain-containing protein n=6 Tax=Fromanvirus packman TaxID=1034142 RepID=G1BR95_9CAUD|nr:hypothetical protein BJD80_gp015 [Mycobacterium phage Catalina]YP_009636059.1 hypothetical protein FGG56_gp14 [Mycobacterium phage PackMan]AMO43962.1 hypothetical protein PBI_MYXUS_94 [Mycobacterium phage Myxus]AOQ29051.1 hypothetical protein SEA_HORTUMSL17_95 [Mycobacterium phage HortumSL17]AOY12014.1 hypothetical protein SEA_PHAEDER_94 [Mycobacterium phage Phaeder]QDF20196.1 hypothetical protein SEA_TUBS_94 [Mycobacterium phage Tubs]QGH80553.1 hypothetical protein SEA_ALITER_87 [Mycobact
MTTAYGDTYLAELRRQREEILSDDQHGSCRLCQEELAEIDAEIAKRSNPTLPDVKLWVLEARSASEPAKEPSRVYASHPQALRDHLTGMAARSGVAKVVDTGDMSGRIDSLGLAIMTWSIREA